MIKFWYDDDDVGGRWWRSYSKGYFIIRKVDYDDDDEQDEDEQYGANGVVYVQ